MNYKASFFALSLIVASNIIHTASLTKKQDRPSHIANQLLRIVITALPDQYHTADNTDIFSGLRSKSYLKDNNKNSN